MIVYGTFIMIADNVGPLRTVEWLPVRRQVIKLYGQPACPPTDSNSALADILRLWPTAPPHLVCLIEYNRAIFAL